MSNAKTWGDDALAFGRCRAVGRRVVRALGMLVPCLCVASWVQASDEPWDDATLVHELLRLDAQAALAAEQGRISAAFGGHGADRSFAQASAMASVAQMGSSHDAAFIQVHAIYGIGQRLHAELSVGAQRYVYRAGRRLPVGMPFNPGEDVPALERIAGACVTLNRHGRTELHCVSRSPSIAQVQP